MLYIVESGRQLNRKTYRQCLYREKRQSNVGDVNDLAVVLRVRSP
jgi:hypothetical protein